MAQAKLREVLMSDVEYRKFLESIQQSKEVSGIKVVRPVRLTGVTEIRYVELELKSTQISAVQTVQESFTLPLECKKFAVETNLPYTALVRI